ncbi:MAG: DNA-3-methyladenine glycosylase I [Saprospiraceae bacterium]|nr:DNA-3-methyladenine glycosylase I [Saprospiraceae bacterium]
MSQNKTRCRWAGSSEPYISYHDREWGYPLHNDQQLFEMINLEGAQAGLSWITILKKRENYRKAFDHFDPEKVARYSAKKISKILLDEGIVRNKLKVNAVVTNAQSYLKLLESFPSFDEYLWQFVDGKPIINRWKTIGEVPAFTAESDALSKDLKKRGFKFVGSTICYAFMQAVGMVNDHTTDCFRWRECQ